MRSGINPFFSRASEYVGSDGKFIKLFSPEILFLFKDYPILNTVNIFRSSPGGGKTTLLKLFTPRVLFEIIKNQKHDDNCKEIHKILKELGVVDDRRPLISASLISFNNEYSSLEHIDLNDTQKERLFYSLLNIRIVISILHSLAITKKINFPDDLHLIEIKNNTGVNIPTTVAKLKTGLDYFNWASSLEEAVCKEMDSFSFDVKVLEGNIDLFSLELFNKQNLFFEGNSVDEDVLVMLDNVHDLSKVQRSHLLNKIINKRPPVTTWVAERLKALTMDEVLEGTTAERDKNTIYLERYWSSKSFEKFARSVADRRVAAVFEDEFSNYSSFLSTSFTNETNSLISKSRKDVEERVRTNFNDEKYKQWLQAKDEEYENDFDGLVSWRSLEILLNRDENKPQKEFDFGNELPEEDLEAQEGTDVKNAAKLFLREEIGIPYYYGFSAISKLSSSNIEQFLGLAGQIFEDILSKKVYKKLKKDYNLTISPERQEDIILKNCKTKWKGLTEKVPNFLEIANFLDSIGKFCYSQTYVPNAWNSPGINGIAITMSDRLFLKDTVLKNPQHPLYKLARCLVTCIAYNLVDYTLNYKCQGKTLMVLYVNRIYCVKYHLPLENGKFKIKKLTDIAAWTEKVYSPPKDRNLWTQD